MGPDEGLCGRAGGVSCVGDGTVRTHQRARFWRADITSARLLEAGGIGSGVVCQAAQSGIAELAAEPVSAGEGSRCGRTGEAVGRLAGAATAAADSSALMWS